MLLMLTGGDIIVGNKGGGEQVGFANRLKQLRKQQSLTQVEFAEIFKISKGAIAMWETGRREPDSKMLEKIAAFFHITTDYLLGITDDPTPPGGSKTEQKPVGIDGELISLLRDLSTEDKEELLRNARRMHELSVLRAATGNKY